MQSAPFQLMVRASDDAPWEPGKFSDMLVEFAQPLLALHEGPKTGEVVRQILNVASVCWNAPVYEALGDGQFMHALEAVMVGAPPPAREILRDMLRDRRARLQDVPFAVLTDVIGEDAEEIRVQAAAYLPRGGSGVEAGAPGGQVRRDGAKVGANDRCPCGSGLKFKKCCRVA
jgi:hypothetical protein